MKKLLSLCVILLMLQSCNIYRKKATVNRYPSQISGVQELVLAVADENIVLTDTIVSRKLGILKSKSVVTVMVPVTYKYYIDLTESYQMQFSGRQGEEILLFKSPDVQAQEPIIHSAEAIVRKKSLLINEQKELNRLLEQLPQKLAQKKMQQVSPEVRERCKEELREFLRNYCRESGLDVREVKVKFKGEWFS